ncbi:type II toxin-antitoxin system VapC family toxin [soil metagenome]
MITAVDTSVLLDVFLPDPRFVGLSSTALQRAAVAGSLMICEIVYAELAAQFSRREQLDAVLEKLEIQLEPVGREAAFAAGRAFRRYRDSGGPKTRMISDFLIGAHAENQASCLLSRDRGFYRSYFKKLSLIDPAGD